jgi:hydroxyacylglutathione hydrolase
MHGQYLKRSRRTTSLQAIALLLFAVCTGAFSQTNSIPSLEPGTLPLSWRPAGPLCVETPPWQVHAYNEQFFLMRQSGCTDFEKPFVFLFFGDDQALLVDTGSRGGNIVPTLSYVIHAYLEKHQLKSMPLTVVHTHAHGDHTAGDKDLLAWSDAAIHVTLIPATVEAEKPFYKISNWPADRGSIDLGGRVIDVIPIPGHQAAGVAFYDRRTGILLTGDNVYPGRLYIQDFKTYSESNERLIRFTTEHPVSHLLGNHIEQKRTAFLDYPVGTIYQPDEHCLELDRSVLLEIRDALNAMKDKPVRLSLADFTLFPTRGDAGPTEQEIKDSTKYIQDQERNKWNDLRK